MTRINAGIDPLDLTDQHLLAEYREIVRLKKPIDEGRKSWPTFKLGTGHVRFFYDKELFLYNRMQSILDEMSNRTMNANMPNVFEPRGNNWIPSDDDARLVAHRIIERVLTGKRKPRWYGEEMERTTYANIMFEKYG